MRLDKTTLAALEATLRLYADPDRALAEVPVLAMLGQDLPTLQARAERLGAALDALAASGANVTWAVRPSEAFTGGGTLPAQGRESRALVLDPRASGASLLAERLRGGSPPVVARIADGRLVLDMLTLADEEVETLATLLQAALAP